MEKDLNSNNLLENKESKIDSQSQELKDINSKKDADNREDKVNNNNLYEQDKMESKSIFVLGVVGLILQISFIFFLFSLITNFVILLKFWTTNWESNELKNNIEIYKILSIIGLFIPLVGPIIAIYFGDKYK